mgnify:FL=1
MQRNVAQKWLHALSKRLLKAWKAGVLGNAKTRQTEEPVPRRYCLLRHVLTDFGAHQIEMDCKEQYNMEIVRLTKLGKPICTIKILFNDGEEIEKAALHGIILPSYNRKYQVIMPEEPQSSGNNNA